MLRGILVCLMLFTFANAKMFQSVDKSKGVFIKEGETKYYCSKCAMDLPKYYKTNHIYKNQQYCSLHCLVHEVKSDAIKEAKVVDVKSLHFIDVKDAFYVVGSKKAATMSVKSKYAFLNKKDAIEFSKKYDGEILTFNEAYKLALMDMEQDKKMIQKKREKKVYKEGEKLYEKKCEKIDVDAFDNIANLKAKLKQQCKVQNKDLQMIAIYLWDTKKLDKKLKTSKHIKVEKGAKCATCGMFVEKYPKWVSMIEDDKKYYFDGVKDMIRFINQSKKKYEKIYVTDYFTTNKLEARRAYYVLGSNVYGPMGKELIPFESEEKALQFKEDHFGGMILRFHEIDEEVMEKL